MEGEISANLRKFYRDIQEIKVDFRYCGYCNPINEELYSIMTEFQKDEELQCALLRIDKTLRHLNLK